MSQPTSQALPRDSRLIALLLSQYTDEADRASIAMLTEFAHRYTREILSDAKVYAEHAAADKERKRDGVTNLTMRDVRLAIQAKTEQSFTAPWPKEFLLPLATTLNRQPLPAIHETYGIRLPPASEQLTAANFDLVPKGRPASARKRLDQSTGNGDITMDADGEDDNDALFDDDEDEGMLRGQTNGMSMDTNGQHLNDDVDLDEF